MAEHQVTEVHQHLLSVIQDPSKPLDEILLRKIDEQAAESLSHESRIQILGAVQALLPTLGQDATPVTSLVVRLIQPNSVKFEQVDALLTQGGSSNDQYIKGLESLDKDVNILTLNLLDKAQASPSDIGLVANKVDVVQEWIRLWLITPHTSVAERAAKVLECFLMAGVDANQATIESNLMVRRVFRDRNIYESIFSLCSFKTLGGPDQPDEKQKTIAQARLLEFLVKIDQTGSPIRVSQFPDIEQHYGIKDPEQGFLYFSFTKMIDYRNDDLMLSTLIIICANYLAQKCESSYDLNVDVSTLEHLKMAKTDSEITGPGSGERATFALAFLKANGLHTICLSYFINPTSDQASWLLGDSLRYLQSYCSVWRDDMIKDENLCTTVLGKLTRQFQNATQADWRSSQTLDLNLFGLKIFPKSLHLLRSSTDDAPLFHVPADTSNESVIGMLAEIFCTVLDYTSVMGEAAKIISQADRMTARVLYLTYYKRYPDLWSNLVRVAETVALTRSALAAIQFMDSFVNAEWALVDEELMPSLPSEAELSQMRGGVAAPSSGVAAMLFERGVAEVVLPYVLAPPKSFNFSTQTRSPFDDSEDPARSVTKAKSRLTTHILERLKEMEPTPEIQRIFEVFTKQVEANSRAEMTQGTGESVATMRR